jgi:hypothetical protein
LPRSIKTIPLLLQNLILGRNNHRYGQIFQKPVHSIYSLLTESAVLARLPARTTAMDPFSQIQLADNSTKPLARVVCLGRTDQGLE